MKTMMNLRTTKEEIRRCKDQGKKRGMNLSAYIRWLIFNDGNKLLDIRKDGVKIK